VDGGQRQQACPALAQIKTRKLEKSPAREALIIGVFVASGYAVSARIPSPKSSRSSASPNLADPAFTAAYVVKKAMPITVTRSAKKH
jgi:hypothetical protein